MMDDLHNLNEKLKQSAEEFSLAPSQQVWKNVEKEIARRRRKRGFFFLLTGTLCVCCAAVWLWFNPADDPVAKQQSPNDTMHSTLAALPADRTAERATAADSSEEKHVISTVAPAINIFPEREDTHVAGKAPAPVAQQEMTGPQHINPGTREQESRITNSRIESQHSPEPVDPEAAPILNPQALTVKKTSQQQDTTHAEQSVVNNDTSVAEQHQVDTTVQLPAVVQPFVIADSVPPKPENRFMIGVGIRPSKSFTRFKELGEYNYIGSYRDSSERALAVCNFQFDIGYRFGETYVFSGVHVTNFRTEMHNLQVVYRYDQGPISGPVPPPVVVSRDYYIIDNNRYGRQLNKLTYVGIPIGARTQVFVRDKLSIWLQAEFTTQYLIGMRNYVYDPNTLEYRKGVPSDMRRWNYSVGTSVHLQYAFDDRFAVALSPGTEDFGSIYKRNYLLRQRFSHLYIQASFHYSF
jgi:hypothetical protein